MSDWTEEELKEQKEKKDLIASHIYYINEMMATFQHELYEMPSDFTAPGAAHFLMTRDPRVMWTINALPDGNNRHRWEARAASYHEDYAHAALTNGILGYGEGTTEDIAICDAWLDWKLQNGENAQRMFDSINSND